MDSYGPFLLFALVALAVGALAYYNWLQEKKRSEAFLAMARQLGLSYRAKDYQLPGELQFLDGLRRGDNRYAFNVLAGEYQKHPVLVFDYHYETHTTDSKGRRQTHHHYLSFFVLKYPRTFPELRIYPEGFFSRVGQFLGLQDIDFESVEFSDAFVVKSSDKKFAYDICHTRMMEYLLAHQSLSLEIEADSLGIGFSTRLEPTEVPDRLRQLVEIRNLFPEYLFQD